MHKYISILRGINVAGKNKILMNDLKTLYELQGFQNVITYIQSGNVIFQIENQADTKLLAAKIEKAIAQKYDLHVPTLILTAEELNATIQKNPFLGQNNIDFTKLHLTFLAEQPNSLLIEKMKALDFSPDRFEIIDKYVFLYCPIDYGKTKLSNNFFESKLKVTATTRNWKTVCQLAEMINN